MKKLLRMIKYSLSNKKDYTFNDSISTNMIASNQIPNWVLDENWIIYNCGKKTNKFVVIATPIDLELMNDV